MFSGSRQIFSRSFSAIARPNKAQGWGDGLIEVVKETSENKLTLPKRTSSLHYKLFHHDQVLTADSLTYENRSKQRGIVKYPSVAPPPSISRKRDIFYQLKLDPRDFSTNPSVLSNYVTEMGKIKSRDQTLLTLKTQRFLGRTIRRAKMMGVIPNLSRY